MNLLSSIPVFPSGRLKHGRHFTYKSVSCDIALTFVAPNVTGASKFVNASQPYALYGSWLQIYIPENFLPEMEAAVNIFNEPNKVCKPFDIPLGKVPIIFFFTTN